MSTRVDSHGMARTSSDDASRRDDQRLTASEFTLLLGGFAALGLSLLSFLAI